MLTRMLALAAVLLLAAAACDDGDPATRDVDEPTSPPATEPIDTTPATTASAQTPGRPLESGEAPVFRRTADNFASLRGGEPYKVLLRVTNGYAGETLRVVAAYIGDHLEVEFTANRADPVGQEAPGSYYPLMLALPAAGEWLITVYAGEDQSSFSVVAA